MVDRRNILRTASAVTALTAWQQPVVSSVVLPAHAVASGICGSLAVIDRDGEADIDAVRLEFDCETCSLVPFPFDDDIQFGQDTVAIFDLDASDGDVSGQSWDGTYAGGPLSSSDDQGIPENNWRVTNWSGNPTGTDLGSDDNPPGVVTFTATRNSGSCAGQSFNFAVSIEITGNATEATMTVTPLITG